LQAVLKTISDEELFRARAKSSLAFFLEYESSTIDEKTGERIIAWQRAQHLELLCSKLEQIDKGELKRLIVTMPPRHGKSETATKKGPAWLLGRDPQREIIISTYGADLAYDFSRIARETMREYGPEIFGVELSKESSSVGRWELKGYRGGLTAAGVGGPITGRGAHIGIIDDPYKNEEEAYSPAYRDKVWNWYQTTFRTRLAPNGAIILIQTRWHEDDLAGRLVAEMEEGGEKWDVLNLPAVAEEDDPIGRNPGEPLWPERYPIEELEAIKSSIGTRWFAALYQGSPRPQEGTMFNREWFKVVDEAPAEVNNKVRYWDLAATEARPGKDPAFTAGAKVGEKNGVYYIYDIRRTQSRPAGVEALLQQTAKLDGRGVLIWIEQEPGSSGVNTIDHYQRQVLRGFAVRGDKVTGPKELRAEPLSAAAEAGNVYLVKGPWVEDFLNEAEIFPAGKFKDQVDCVAGAVGKLSARSGEVYTQDFA